MPTDLKVVSTYRFTPTSQQLLREAASAEVVCVTNQEEFIAQLPEAEILCTFSVPTNWAELAPHLRWLQYPGAGVDGLRPSGLLDQHQDRVIVTTASGIHATTISEYVFGSMLMFNWNWPQMVRLQDGHVWAPSSGHWYNLGGRELAGSTLGIVGLGHIGRRIAQLGRAFGMRVLGMRRSFGETTQDPDLDQGYTPQGLLEMLGQCDYVVLAVPLTPQTEHLIGETELRAMKSNAYLVNIARGRVIDEKALVRALNERWIAGAGLDVAEIEPLPSHSPLYGMPNVILTPHVAGVSIHYERRLAELFAQNLRRYRSGEALLNRFDPARGY
ncbi:MAG TPA: D-2-hydroxyacid dehydrogenase [Ktedonobacteraceae bacterium]|nr:D-2-hydroxyacid dehydrogenase [Ktedonobacteraceae bacterium]